MKTYYHDNAYRIFGVPSTGTRAEIKNVMQSLKVRAKTGGLHAMDDALAFMDIRNRCGYTRSNLN